MGPHSVPFLMKKESQLKPLGKPGLNYPSLVAPALHPVRARLPRLRRRGRELARLHLEYEQFDPSPLKFVTTDDVPLSYRVEDKMRLSKDKTTLRVNPS